MIEPLHRDIDGLHFELAPLTAFKGVRMFHRLGRALGPALGQLLGAFGGPGPGSEKLGDMDVAKALPALAAALPRLFESVTEAELEAITRELLGGCIVTHEGRMAQLMPQFDLLLQGRVSTVLKLLAFAIEVNYGNFIDVLGALAQPHLTASRPSSADSRQTSMSAGHAGASS